MLPVKTSLLLCVIVITQLLVLMLSVYVWLFRDTV